MHTKEQKKQIAFIQLKGEPYQQILENGEIVDCNEVLDNLAYNSNYEQGIEEKVFQAEEHLEPLFYDAGYYLLDSKLKHGQNLSFSEAFSLITFVASALNRPLFEVVAQRIQNLGPYETHILQAVALLSSMSTKEGFSSLTADEIAGMVAATVHLDTVARASSRQPILAFGGMGGDKGYLVNGQKSKLFSLSTLSAVAAAVVGPTHKHHSYPNTSKIAGQSAIEAYGARSDFHSLAAFQGVLQEADLLMTSCHSTRTLHTLSHLLRGETINHVIGPIAFTLSQETNTHGFIGVNEKVHPQTVIEALQILTETGYQNYDASAVFCGTNLEVIPKEMFSPDTYYSSSTAKEHIRIDEIAPPPYASLVSFKTSQGRIATFALYPHDFYNDFELEYVRFEQLAIPNTAEDILHFNTEAILGRDEAKARYLAMTIGLGIFVRKFLHLENALDFKNRRVNPRYLRSATEEALAIIKSGQAVDKLQDYVQITQRYSR